jgi:hypothetical protein
MYRPLHTIIKPLIDSKATGVLNIVHYSNERGRIYFSSGNIVRISIDELKGNEAAEKIFSWVSFFAKFTDKSLKITATPEDIKNTEKIINYLAKLKKIIEKIKINVQGCETVFQLNKAEMNNGKKLNQEEQSIAFAMNGTKTVIEILVKSRLSEFQVLSTISNLAENKIIGAVRSHGYLSGKESKRFFSILMEILSDITGPVASVIVDEVFDSMGITRENLCRSDMGPFLNFIRNKLDPDEQDALNPRDIVFKTFQ